MSALIYTKTWCLHDVCKYTRLCANTCTNLKLADIFRFSDAERWHLQMLPDLVLTASCRFFQTCYLQMHRFVALLLAAADLFIADAPFWFMQLL